MLLYSFIAMGLAILFLGISLKITNQIWQLIIILLGLLCLCCSIKFSFIPLEVLMIIAFLMITPQIRSPK